MQSPSEPRKESIFLDKTDTEMRELLIQLVAQNKEQQDQIKAMNLVLEEVLAQQATITIVNKLHATEMPWESESKRKVSAQTSNEDAKKVVKPFGPRAEPSAVRDMRSCAQCAHAHLGVLMANCALSLRSF